MRAGQVERPVGKSAFIVDYKASSNRGELIAVALDMD
jgi:hypothetical protein